MNEWRNIKKKILTDLKVELLDEFDQNFTRKAFFDQPWQRRSYPSGRGSLMQVTGRGRRSVRSSVRANGVTYYSDTSYMGLHNAGGKVKITPRMRKFFWAMYYKAGGKGKKPKPAALYWRGLALTKKSAITMPKRQVIGDHPRVQQVVRTVVNGNLQRCMASLAEVLNRH